MRALLRDGRPARHHRARRRAARHRHHERRRDDPRHHRPARARRRTASSSSPTTRRAALRAKAGSSRAWPACTSTRCCASGCSAAGPHGSSCLYLSKPERIITAPSDQTLRGVEVKTNAVMKAVRTACARDDFRPRTSALCAYCSFQEFCPEFGGDPELARPTLVARQPNARAARSSRSSSRDRRVRG